MTFRDDYHDVVDWVELSHDAEEGKWSYFREDSLLHVFHSLSHKVYSGMTGYCRFEKYFNA